MALFKVEAAEAKRHRDIVESGDGQVIEHGKPIDEDDDEDDDDGKAE